MKNWIHVEKAFQDAGIDYRQKDWVFLVEIDSRKFYYSPQSGKWRIKRARAWQKSKSVQDFIELAQECLRSGKESKESQRARRRSNRKRRKTKKKGQKTKASSYQRQDKHHQDYRQNQELKDEVRPEFLELFDEKMRICNERDYKPAWIWKTLLDKYLLTPKEICWLCTVFDYSPGWAFHQAKDQYPGMTYEKILALIANNGQDWLEYFTSRWQFASKTESKEEKYTKEESRRERYRQQDYQRQKNHREATQRGSGAERYQNYLHLLQLKFPFSRKELKSAYRKKARSTHPDTGGTTEAFRKVHTAFEILSALAS